MATSDSHKQGHKRAMPHSENSSTAPKLVVTSEQEEALSPSSDHSNTPPIDEFHQPKLLRLDTGSDGGVKTLSATSLANEVGDIAPNLRERAVVENDKGSMLTESRVLVLYTGGTIGMCVKNGVYEPEPLWLPRAIREMPPLNDKEYVEAKFANATIMPYALPPIRHMGKRVIYWVVEYEPLLDSSDMTFDDWIRIAKDIYKSYANYDGFVVLHGTDTLAYTACALSFMLENLGKPVVLTGAQIPVSEVRSDGRENLIGALIVAGNLDIPEVTILFNNKLLRGNRSTKVDNSALEAFTSPNMDAIASMDIEINVTWESIFRSPDVAPFAVQTSLCRNVGVLRIFPSMNLESVKAFLQAPMQGIVLQTFGAGNMPSKRTDILEALRQATERGCIIVNCSQCVRGQVDSNYLTGKILLDVGVIPGSDMTPEAALTKLSYVLGNPDWDLAKKRKMMSRNLRGEMSVARSENATLNDLEIVPRLMKFLRISSSHEVQLLRNALFPPLLCYAANIGDLDLIDHLKESGAALSFCNYDMRTALHVAASAGNINTINHLLRHGASVHARDYCDENPLMSAVRTKKLDCIKALRAAGGQVVMSQTNLGMELCLAASKNDLAALRAWKEAGVDMGACDYDGRSALLLSAAQGYEELVVYLLECGVDAKKMDNFGRTPLFEAEAKGFGKISQLIREACAKQA